MNLWFVFEKDLFLLWIVIIVGVNLVLIIYISGIIGKLKGVVYIYVSIGV